MTTICQPTVSPSDFLRDLAGRGVSVTLSGDGVGLSVRAPRGVVAGELAEQIRQVKPALIEHLRHAEREDGDVAEPSDDERAFMERTQMTYLAALECRMPPGKCAAFLSLVERARALRDRFGSNWINGSEPGNDGPQVADAIDAVAKWWSQSGKQFTEQYQEHQQQKQPRQHW